MKTAQDLIEDLAVILDSIGDQPFAPDIIDDFDFPDYLTHEELGKYISDLEDWASYLDADVESAEEIREEFNALKHYSNDEEAEFKDLFDQIMEEYQSRSCNIIDEYQELYDDLRNAGETAIEEDSFHDYAIEMIKDCYPEFNKILESSEFPYNCLTFDEDDLVDQVRQDYTEREISGKTYIYRA